MKKLKTNEDLCRERVAEWIIEQGYATGHGDTLEDLLNELISQVAEDAAITSVKYEHSKPE